MMLVFLSFERCLATAFSSLKSPAHGFRGEIGVFGLCNLKATITSFHPLNAAIPFVKPSSCLAGSFVFSYKLKSNALCSSASPSIPSSTPLITSSDGSKPLIVVLSPVVRITVVMWSWTNFSMSRRKGPSPSLGSRWAIYVPTPYQRGRPCWKTTSDQSCKECTTHNRNWINNL